MPFTDLTEDVASLFEEAQERHQEAANYQALLGGGFIVHAPREGCSVRSPSRRLVVNALKILRRREEIRDRLLSGERPRLGRPGPFPKIWFDVAKEIGIDLGEPPAPSERALYQRKWLAKRKA